MKLTKNSWHYTAYQLLTGNTPNNNFCDYFWALVLNVFTLPITFPIYVVFSIVAFLPDTKVQWIDNINYNLVPKTHKEKFIELSGLGLPFKIATSLCLFIFLFLLITYTLKTIIGLSIVALFVGKLILITKFEDSDSKSKISENIHEIAQITGEAWLSFKGKYCPKIEWKEQNIINNQKQ